MPLRLSLPQQTLHDQSGAIAAGGTLEFFIAGTSTPLSVFTDSALSLGETTIITADAAGLLPAVFLQDTLYKLVAKTSTAQTIWTEDNVDGAIRFADRVNVKDFGANGDGVTDDTVAIQAAIDAAELLTPVVVEIGAGAQIYFPRGEYLISNTLTVTESGIVLVGDSINTTMITVDAAFDGTAISFALPNPETRPLILGVGVRDMTIRSLGDNPTTGAGILFDQATKGLIEDVNLLNHYIGIDVHGGDTNWIKKVNIQADATVLQAGSAAIKIHRRETGVGSPTAVQDTADSKYYDEPNSVYISDANTTLSNSGFEHAIDIDAVDGLYLTNSHIGGGTVATIRMKAAQANLGLSNVLVSNVFVDPTPGTTQHGIFYENNAALASNFVFRHHWSNITIGDPDDFGILVQEDVKRITFNGGGINNAGDSAVDIQDGQEFVFSGMVFFRSNTKAGTAAHVRIVGATDVIVTGCILDEAYRGVQTGGAVTDRVIVTNNQFLGMTDTSVMKNIFLGATEDNDRISGNISDSTDVVASAGTLEVPPEFDVVSISGTTTINNIDASPTGGRSSWEGRVLTLVFEDVLNVTEAGNIDLQGAASFATTANDTLTVMFRGGTWYEVSRSVN